MNKSKQYSHDVMFFIYKKQEKFTIYLGQVTAKLIVSLSEVFPIPCLTSNFFLVRKKLLPFK